MRSTVRFDIYGAREDTEYWKACQKEILKAPKNITYNYKGVLPLTEIEHIYLGYDCLLHPTHSENYGHVIVEAFCHDCPIVISKGTTPWDDAMDYGAGYVCNLDNEKEFIEALERIAGMNDEAYKEMINGTRNYAARLELGKLKESYISMIEEVVSSECR